MDKQPLNVELLQQLSQQVIIQSSGKGQLKNKKQKMSFDYDHQITTDQLWLFVMDIALYGEEYWKVEQGGVQLSFQQERIPLDLSAKEFQVMLQDLAVEIWGFVKFWNKLVETDFAYCFRDQPLNKVDVMQCQFYRQNWLASLSSQRLAVKFPVTVRSEKVDLFWLFPFVKIGQQQYQQKLQLRSRHEQIFIDLLPE